MKKYSIALIIAVFSLSTFVVNAQQTIKLGHISSQELLAAMPQTDSAQATLQKLQEEHALIFEEMNVEFNKKFESYRKSMQAGSLSELARATKEGELEDLQTRIQTFEQSATETLQQKQVELLTPVQEMALNAVNKVAEAHGFTYIFDTGMGTIVYTAPDSEDILPLVKAELGIE